MNSLLGRLRNFFVEDLWSADLSDLRWWRKFLLQQGQLWTVVFRGFFTDRCILRASALTFTTLLSVVPLLALMFSVLKGLGVQNTLQSLLLEKLAAGSGDVVTLIITYINNTNVASLGTFGLVFLVMTVLTLLSNIEKSFNKVWGVDETRPLLRRFTDYFSVVTIGPIFVVVAISMTSTLKSQTLVQGLMERAYVGEIVLLLFKILPFMVMWLVFAGLYLFMPNTKVNPRAALLGGICGGTLWQLGQWLYLELQVGVARYNAIYGTMAALPVFMVWIYLSWAIVLFGLEFTYATQNLASIRQEIRGQAREFVNRELVALTILVFLGRRFYRGEPALEQEKIAVGLEIRPRLLRDVLETLRKQGYVAKISGENEASAYQPGCALEAIRIHDFLQTYSHRDAHIDQHFDSDEKAAVAGLAGRLAASGRDALDGMTLRDLVRQIEEEGAANQVKEDG